MPYIPLNRIKTGLYTSGDQYVRVDTGEYYTGPYYELYDGTFFTGESPNDNTSVQLVVEEASDWSTSDYNLTVTPVVPIGDGDSDPALSEQVIPINISNYRLAKGEDPDSSYKKKLPEPFIPTPTEQDYKVTEFRRYFAKKQNEYYFVEINKNTFDKLVTHNSEYYWQVFNCAQIPWRIAGEKSEVEKVNKNITQLAETRFKVPGLSKYLNYDYLKFYKES